MVRRQTHGLLERALAALICAAQLVSISPLSAASARAQTISPTWSSTPNLATSRYALGAAVGSDGRVYAVGGFNQGSAGDLSSVEAYDPQSNTWGSVTPLPTPRFGIGVTAGADGRIYVIGGARGASPDYVSSNEVYDPHTNSWSTLANMPTARAFLGLTRGADGKIYAIGGQTGGGPTATVEVYDPTSNTWSSAASVPSPVADLAAATGSDNRIYAVGGIGPDGHAVSTVSAFDTVAGTWSTAPGLASPTQGLAAVSGLDGRIYALGGNDGSGAVSAALQAFKPGDSAWTALAQMPTPRSSLAVAQTADGHLFAIGGISNGAPLNTVETIQFVNTSAPPPVVSISSPADGAVITGSVDVIGTVTSSNLSSYRVSVSPHGQNTWLDIATGAASVTNARIATIDPTRFAAGMLDLRLLAVDTRGQSTSEVQSFVTDTVGEVGETSFTLTDMKLSLVGVPITILRSYDSFNRASGDFGVDWSMQLENVERVDRTNPAGDGWTFSGNCVFTSQTAELKPHLYVFRVLGRAITYAFSPIFEGCGLGETFYQVHFVPVGNVFGTTLSGYGEGSELVLPNDGKQHMLNPDLTLFDPPTFTLTFPNGRAYTVSVSGGLQAVRDARGNQITITPSGITHSSGLAVSFTRDSAGRITAISRPDGKQRTYEYDGTGDLVAASDFGGARTQYVYDANHNLLRIIDPTGKTTLAGQYAADGRLIGSTDANGNSVGFQYDTANRIQTIIDRTGATVTVTYDERGLVTSKSDATGRTLRYEYDANGNRTAEMDPLGNRTQYTYDALGRATAINLPTGITQTMTYDAAGRLTSQSDGLGHTESHTYDAKGNETSYTDKEGGTTTFTYDANGSLVSERDAAGDTMAFQYDSHGFLNGTTDVFGINHTLTLDALGDPIGYSATLNGKSVSASVGYTADGLPTTVVGPSGETSSLAYDADNQLTSGTNPIDGPLAVSLDGDGRPRSITIGSGSTTYTRDAEGRMLSQTSPAGRTQTTTRDQVGRPLRETFADGTTLSHTYAANGLLSSDTDALQNTTSYGYDTFGRLTSVHDPLGLSSSYSYDALGQLTTKVDAAGVQTTYTRNGRGDVSSVSIAGAPAATYSYDGVGRASSYTDPNGNTTSLAYGPTGGIAQSTDGAGNTAHAVYSTTGLTGITDANSHSQSFVRDPAGNVLSHTLPDGSTESFIYDIAHGTTTRTGYDGHTVARSFSPQRRITRELADDGTQVNFSYDADGYLLGLQDARGSTSLGLDSGGRLINQTEPSGPAVAYAYDAGGRLASVSVGPDLVRYAEDADGHLISVTDWAGRTTNLTYDTGGRLSTVTDPDGSVETRTYNSRGQLASINVVDGPTTVFGEQYTYDAGGRVTSAVQANGRRTDYLYDAADRIVSETVTPTGGGSPQVTRYGYDPAGNITSIVSPTQSQTFTYDMNDRIVSNGVASYTYDREGRLTAVVGGPNAANLIYDGLGRPIEVDTTGSALGVHTIRYTYDAQGLIATRTTDGVVRQFVWDRHARLPQVLEELDAAGNVVSRNLVALGGIRARESSGAVRYFHPDRIGSIRAVTDGTGQTVQTLDFSAYGELTNALLDDVTGYGFAGQRVDPATGLYFLRARYYDPSLGRFLTPDQGAPDLRVPDSVNRYAYALANPLTFVDPTGLEADINEAVITEDVAAELAVQDLKTTIAVTSVETQVLAAEVFVGIDNQVGFSDRAKANPNLKPDATIKGEQVSGGGLLSIIGGLEYLNWRGANHPYSSADYAYSGYGFGGFSAVGAQFYAGKAFATPTPQDYEGEVVSLTLPTFMVQSAMLTSVGALRFALNQAQKSLLGGQAFNFVSTIGFSPTPPPVDDPLLPAPPPPFSVTSGYGRSWDPIGTIPTMFSFAYTVYSLISATH